MRRAIRAYWIPFAVIVAFACLSTALGAYILGQQRLQSPFASRYSVRLEFSATPGLAPGLGQPIDVAGVPVGEITGAEVHDGRALVTVSIERSQLPHVYADATAALVPNTPLQDLQIDLDPGRAPAPALGPAAILPVGQSTVPVAADSLLRALDGDTRSYLAALISATGYGLHGRGPDLRALLAQIGPTARQVHEFASALAARRFVLARVVHSLSVLAVAAGGRDAQIRQAVAAGSATLEAMARQDTALRSALTLLPGTLAQTRTGLAAASRFAGVLTPTLQSLRPAVRGLPAALSATGRLARVSTPKLRDVVRPLVATGTASLKPVLAAAPHLNAVTPDLDNSFRVLQYLFDELLYSAGGTSRSYAFYGAWAQHDGNSVLASGDAHGEVIRSALIVSCSELNAIPGVTSLISGLAGLLGSACPAGGQAP